MPVAEFADIASYQRGADLAAYERAGHDRILLKATEVTGYLNPVFTTRWRLAGELDLKARNPESEFSCGVELYAYACRRLLEELGIEAAEDA